MALRRKKDPLSDVDPSTVGERWRAEVISAVAAARRYGSIVERTAPGPVRDRLSQMGDEVTAAVRAVHRVAVETDHREATLGELGPDEITRRLKDARRDLGRAEDDGRDTSLLRATVESLDRQLGAVHTVWDAVERAREELHVLRLRLDEIVTLAGAVASQLRDPADGRLDAVAQELDGLRSALDDLASG